MSLLAGTAKVEITCRKEGAAAYVVSEKTKAHIPRELWDKKIEIDDPLYLKALVLDDGSRKYVLITMDATAGINDINLAVLNGVLGSMRPFLVLLRKTAKPLMDFEGGEFVGLHQFARDSPVRVQLREI